MHFIKNLFGEPEHIRSVDISDAISQSLGETYSLAAVRDDGIFSEFRYIGDSCEFELHLDRRDEMVTVRFLNPEVPTFSMNVRLWWSYQRAVSAMGKGISKYLEEQSQLRTGIGKHRPWQK